MEFKEPKDRLIVALEYHDNFSHTLELVACLKPYVRMFKVGIDLFIRHGDSILRDLAFRWKVKIFFDPKLHDTPNAVLRASREIARLNVQMFTVHCAGEFAMLQTACAGNRAGSEGAERPLVLGVTVLTSSIGEDPDRIRQLVVKRSSLAYQAGLDGVVAPGKFVRTIKANFPKLLVVVPGIRRAGENTDDHQFVKTPAEAIRAGADYLVVGRPIINDPHPVAAAQRIVDEMAAALEKGG